MNRLLEITRLLVGESHCDEVQQELKELLNPRGIYWDWEGKEEFVVLVNRDCETIEIYLFQKDQWINDVKHIGSIPLPKQQA